MRSFIAIELPAGIKEYLRQLQEKVKDIAKLSLVSDFHITMKFLGEIDENKLEKIKEALSKIEFSQFRMHLSDAGFFPSESYMRVLWVGLEPEKDAVELQKKIDSAMLGLGFAGERDFKAHLTLARIKFIENDKKKQLVDAVKALKIEEKEFTVDRISLIKSMLTAKGAVYEILYEKKAE